MAVFYSSDMRRVFLVCVLISAASSGRAAEVDSLYQDLPDDLIIEEIAKRLEARHAEQLQSRYGDYGVVDSDVTAPLPDFTYQFSPDTNGNSQFAVAPQDARYYQDTRPLNQNNAPLQSLADDDDTYEPPARVNVAKSTARPAPAILRPAPKAQPAALPEDDASHAQVVQVPINAQEDNRDHIYFIAIVGGCSAAAVVGVIAIGVSWYKLQRNAKAAADVEYPAYGVTGPHKDASPTGDRKLAQSAQMYHYQHQKQQIIALENRVASERVGSVSEPESDEENEEGDYTVYECPGLAPAGEMEVKNPLFLDDPTPATPAVAANQSKPVDGSPANK